MAVAPPGAVGINVAVGTSRFGVTVDSGATLCGVGGAGVVGRPVVASIVPVGVIAGILVAVGGMGVLVGFMFGLANRKTAGK